MIKLEVGKMYRNRVGQIRGPLAANDHDDYPFKDGDLSYTSNGSFVVDGKQDDLDLVEEHTGSKSDAFGAPIDREMEAQANRPRCIAWSSSARIELAEKIMLADISAGDFRWRDMKGQIKTCFELADTFIAESMEG